MSRISPHYDVVLHSRRRNVRLTCGRHFRFGFDSIFELANSLPERLEDLLRIGLAVTVADRLCRRKQTKDGRHWPRNLPLTIHVHDLDFWSSATVCRCLHEVIDDLSGDYWDITFVQDRSPRPSFQGSLLAHRQCDDTPLICLYSGGLDSAAGLARRIHESAGTVIPVSVISQSQQRMQVESQLAFLSSRSSCSIYPMTVRSAMIWRTEIENMREESTQRSRSFLFMSVGAAAAILTGAAQIEVFESGVGSLNVPLMAGMVGSMATRSCHPAFLRGLGQLVSLVADREVRFALPFADSTKGEMVRWVREHGMDWLVHQTVSCASYPVRFGKQQPCGICSACIFRRQAISVGGIGEPSDFYKYDLLSQSSTDIPEEKFATLKAFLLQASALRRAREKGKLPPAITTHLLNAGLGEDGRIPEKVVNLLGRYGQEWMEFAGHGAKGGAVWPRILLGKSSMNAGGPHVQCN